MERVEAHLIHAMSHFLNEGYRQNGRALRSRDCHFCLSMRTIRYYDGVSKYHKGVRVSMIGCERLTAMRDLEQEYSISVLIAFFLRITRTGRARMRYKQAVWQSQRHRE